jgi:death-on-curing family protein
LRDLGAVEAALARPRNLAAYGKRDLCDLAAAYAFGLARSHGFVDGNKRAAWVVARVFLADNDARLRFAAPHAVRLMERVAGDELTEVALAAWFRERLAA